MLGDAYTLEILPQFEEDLNETVDYISLALRNPDAADRLVDAAFDAIHKRLEAP